MLLPCAILALSSCATEIVGSTESTIPLITTTSEVPSPTGDIISLITQLNAAADGLGQLVVDGKTSDAQVRVAQADAIMIVLEPLVQETRIDIVDDLKRIVALFHTAVERKRPADADKALRFSALMLDSIPQLLTK